jgi:O-acetylserine/cysteine efflux transporter
MGAVSGARGAPHRRPRPWGAVPVRHVLLALAVTVVWGVNFVVIHWGLESFPPLLFAALRFAAVALPGVWLVGRPGVPWRWVVAVGATTSTGQFALLFTSMELGMPAGLASLVLQLQVVFTVGLAVLWLGERPSRVALGGMAVALAGMGVIALGRSAAVPLVALALCVGAAALWAVGNVCTRIARPPDALAMLVWSSVVPPVPLAALSLWLEGGDAWADALGGLSLGGVAALGYVVLLSTVFGYGAWTWLLRRHEASRVVPFTLLVPVVGIATAWLALGELPNAAEWAGAVLVLAGLGLTTLRLRRPARVAVAVPAPR